MGALRPWLRLAVRDARAHLGRTAMMLAVIALPLVAVLTLLASLTPEVTPRQAALNALPGAARAEITASTVGGAVQQRPEQLPPAPRDPAVTPVSPEDLLHTLPPGSELHEWWVSGDLIATTALDLPVGDTRPADVAHVVGELDPHTLSTLTLREADAATLTMLIGTAPTDETGIILTEAAARAIGVREGDDLQLVAPPDTGWMSSDGRVSAVVQNSQRAYRVTAIIPGDDAQAWALPTWIAPMISADQIGVDRHFLLTGSAPITWDHTRRLNAEGVFVISRDVLENYPNRSELYPQPVDLERLATQAVLLAAATAGTVALLAVLVTPAFVVGAGRMRRSFGVMVATGARPRRAGTVFLFQALLLGLFGGAFGISGGLVASLLTVHRLPPLLAILAALILTLAVALLASLPAARAVTRLDPVDALADRRRLAGGGRRRPLPGFLPPMVRLAARDAGRHPARTIPALAAVIGCTASLTALSILVGSAQSNGHDTSTAMVAPGRATMGITTPVSNDVDHAIITAVLADMPVADHGSLWSVGMGGPLIEAAPREECGVDEGHSVRSALDPSAPIECVRWDRAWSPGLRFPTWVGNQVTIMDPATLRMTGIPGADEAADALADGAVIINNAARLQTDGTVQLRVWEEDASQPVPLVTRPGFFLRGFEPELAISPQTAAELHLPLRYVGEVVVPKQSLTPAVARQWEQQARDVTDLAWPSTHPTADLLGLETSGGEPSPAAPIMWGLTGVAALAVMLALALGRTDAEADLVTLQAVGASPRHVRRYGLAQAGIVLLLGIPPGLLIGALGAAALLAVLRTTQVFGPFLHPTMLPLTLLVPLAVLVIATLSGALLVTPRRADLTRRP